jgi:hypothetical protein
MKSIPLAAASAFIVSLACSPVAAQTNTKGSDTTRSESSRATSTDSQKTNADSQNASGGQSARAPLEQPVETRDESTWGWLGLLGLLGLAGLRRRQEYHDARVGVSRDARSPDGKQRVGVYEQQK